MVLEEAGPLQYGRQGLAKAYKAGNLNLFTLQGTLSVPASFVTAVDSSWEKAKPWKGLNSMSRVTMQEILSRSGLQPLPFEVTVMLWNLCPKTSRVCFRICTLSPD